jgi:uncharacterized membrane protein
MLLTVVLLLLCALVAIAGVPLILKLIPPNDVYGFVTERTRSRAQLWYEVNRFAGWALVAVAVITALAIMVYSGTLLRPFWRQLVMFLVMLGLGAGATFWFERNPEQLGKWMDQLAARQARRGKSARRSSREVKPRRHA